MFEKKLAKIRAVQEPYGTSLMLPATHAQVDALQSKAGNLGLVLPHTYVVLLEETDGLEENGYIIYSSETKIDEASGERLIGGFVEENVGWRADGHEDHLVVFGEGHTEFFVFDLTQETYHAIDRVSHDPLETFATAEELFDSIFDLMIGFDE